jgi:hypothetical protein
MSWLEDWSAVIGSPSTNTLPTMDAIKHSWPKGAAAVKGKNLLISVGITVALAMLVTGVAISAQDKYTLKVPDGLAFSEFRGYDGWQTISVSHNGGALAVIRGVPFMTLISWRRIASGSRTAPGPIHSGPAPYRISRQNYVFTAYPKR